MVQIDSSVSSGMKKIAEQVAAVSSFHGYQDTAYYLPISYAISGSGIDSKQAAEQVFAAAHQSPLVGAEILLACRGASDGPPYTGFIEDAVIRKLGYTLVDGSILGLALIVGNPSTADYAAAICRELQEKLMLTFLSGGVIESLTAAGVKVGLDLRLVPLGKDSLAAVHFADILARVAMMFGGVAAGDAHRLVAYASERAKAFVIAFPGMTEEEIAFIDGLRVLGIPIIHMGGYEGQDWTQAGPTEIVRIGMELRGIRCSGHLYSDPDGLLSGPLKERRFERRRCMPSLGVLVLRLLNSSGSGICMMSRMGRSRLSARRSMESRRSLLHRLASSLRSPARR